MSTTFNPYWLEPGAAVPVDIATTAALVTEIQRLRQALAEPDMGIDRGAWDDVPDATKWVDELRGGDETEEKEPVAWMYVNRDGECEQIEFGTAFDDPSVTLLYTAPPGRKWVGLTDEEREYLWGITPIEDEDRFAFALAVEAKLKEKNHG